MIEDQKQIIRSKFAQLSLADLQVIKEKSLSEIENYRFSLRHINASVHASAPPIVLSPEEIKAIEIAYEGAKIRCNLVSAEIIDRIKQIFKTE